ncbi:hypothetical protein LJC69_05630 [Bacteroidales bacterium OttesenSCG-928-K22]|nr:hypothetical protein [Bacteroidales bacterium OttesenSCG-928-K22]
MATTKKTTTSKSKTLSKVAKPKTSTKTTKPKTTKSKTSTTTAKPKVTRTATTSKTNDVAKKKSTNTEIRVSGQKMIKAIQHEFSREFSFLRLSIFPYSEKNKSTKSPFQKDTKIGDVRKKDTAGEITINGRKHVKTLEKEFELVFGLYAQVCYTDSDGSRYYTSGSYDEKTLSQLNKLGEELGWQKTFGKGNVR